jgi:uncharacterized membrane protein (UPF0127 family)
MMQKYLIHNLDNSEMLPLRADYCASFLCRLRGLTFRSHLSADEGLLLVQKSDSRLDAAIHMLGVWMDLGVVWINAAMKVVDLRLARSWRPLYVPQHPARFVLESDPIRLKDFRLGDKIYFEENHAG